MQPVPVKRVLDEPKFASSNNYLRRTWTPDVNGTVMYGNSTILPDMAYRPPRYVLSTSLDDADEDGKLTRFICRFHTLTIEEEGESKLKQVILGETLSNYSYNPEHANYLKRGSKPMLTSLEQGHDEQIWNAVYSIQCPVPYLSDGVNTLSSIIASGASVSESIPSLYLDLVPIRTPVRRNKGGFGLPDFTSPQHSDQSPPFDPNLVWGQSHVLPRVEASGRWSNIPICTPATIEKQLSTNNKDNQHYDREIAFSQETIESDNGSNKTHFLVGCVWASHSFSTRGQQHPTDSSTSDRLLEFITYHLEIAGFDHIFVYDNSDTSTHERINLTLSSVTDLFPRQRVSRIPWPHRVCNNNRPAHSNPGERSSQYAAESSCRARYGSQTEWLISLDVDEYLIPVSKKWANIKEWLMHVSATEKTTKILSFYQTRALPNVDLMLPYNGSSDAKSCTVKSSDADDVWNSMCAMKVRTQKHYNAIPSM